MEGIEYKIIKSKRKTLVIQVKAGGKVVVRAPSGMSDERINKFVDGKRDWIVKAVAKQKEKEKAMDFSFEEGGKVKVFGEDYTVHLVDARGVIQDDYAYLRKDNPKQSFSNLAALYIRKYVGKRLPEIAKKYGFTYSGYRITNATSRWGSCGIKNALNFTRALVCLPPFVIDYVIIHELCHTRVRNHSAAFYAEVRRVMPDYAKAEKVLKESAYIAKVFH